MDPQITRHAAARIRQRGLRESDVAFVLAHGTPVPDGYMLTAHDAADLEREARHLMAMAQRLKGKLVVTSGAAVVTAYHACRARQKHALA